MTLYHNPCVSRVSLCILGVLVVNIGPQVFSFGMIEPVFCCIPNFERCRLVSADGSCATGHLDTVDVP